MPNELPPAIEAVFEQADALRARRGDLEGTSAHLLAALVASDDINVRQAFRRAKLDPELSVREVYDTLSAHQGPIEAFEGLSGLKALVRSDREALARANPPDLAVTLHAAAKMAAKRIDAAGTGTDLATRLRWLCSDLWSRLSSGSAAATPPPSAPPSTASASGRIPPPPASLPPGVGGSGKSGDTSTSGDKTQPAAISDLGTDLTAAARRGEIHAVYGRTPELLQLIGILTGRGVRNPIILGEPGVGKTALVEGLAVEIAEGDVPEALRSVRVVSVEVGSLVAGTNYRGTFEAKIQRIIEAAEKDPDLIVFIDEIHMLIGAGASDSQDPVDAANMLKPALTDGRLRIIGATTQDEYREFIERDGALARRFSPVNLDAPSPEATLGILQRLRGHLEEYHGVTLEDSALAAAVELSVKYLMDRNLPDKAIRLLDRACSQERLRAFYGFDDIRELSPEEQQVLLESVGSRPEPTKEELRVTAEDIELAISETTGIPVGRLRQGETEQLLQLEERIGERVIGQEHAVKRVAEAIRVARAGLADERRPIGVFLLVGPTGTGKTELAKAIAATVFHDEDALVRVDMSECHDHSFINRLIGSPAGYAGSERGGILTEAVRKRPHTVVLLDEIEKADPAVHMLLLGLMDEGMLTDGLGRKVSFRNTIIMLTSNVGSSGLATRRQIGFGGSEEGELSTDDVESIVHEALGRTFPPEFINRIDATLVFAPLSRQTIAGIARKLLDGLRMPVRATDAALDYLVEHGYDPAMGARPLKRLIKGEIVEPLAGMVLRGELSRDSRVLVDVADGALTLSADADDAPPA